MARAAYRLYAVDEDGNALSGATFKIYQKGTGLASGGSTSGTPFASSIYLAESGGAPAGSTLTALSNGQRLMFVDATDARRFDIGVEATGQTARIYPSEDFALDTEDVITRDRLGFVNALNLAGVTNDGVTDVRSIWNDAIEELHDAGGGEFFIPRGKYRLSDSLNVYGDVALVGAGMGETTLLFDDASDAEIVAHTKQTWSVAVQGGMSGLSTAGGAAIIANTTAGDRWVELSTWSDHAEWSVGDPILIFSETYPGGAGSSWGGFWTRVQRKNTGGATAYLWLEDSVPYSITTTPRAGYRTDTATQGNAVRTANRAIVRDLTISVGDGSGNEILSTNRYYGLYIVATDDVLVSDVEVKGHLESAIHGSDNRNLRVRGLVTKDNLSSEGIAATNYSGTVLGGVTGVNMYRCTVLDVAGCSIERSAWGMVINGSQKVRLVGNTITGRTQYESTDDPASDKTANAGWPSTGAGNSRTAGRGMKFQGGCINCTMVGNTITDATMLGIYILDSSYCTVIGNTLLDIGAGPIAPATKVGAPGIIVGGASPNTASMVHNSIIGNTLRGILGNAISVGNTDGDLAGTATYCTVVGNTIGPNTSVGDGGIYVTSIGNVITGNVIENVVGNGIDLDTGSANNVVTGNVINVSGTALTTSDGSGGNSVWGNEIIGGGQSLHATDNVGNGSALVTQRPALAVGSTVDPTFTNTTLADAAAPVNEMAVTLTTQGGDLDVDFNGTFSHSNSGGQIFLGIQIDAVATVQKMAPTVAANNQALHLAFTHRFSSLAAGSHTVRVRVATNANTVTAVSTFRSLRVTEVRI